MIEIADKLRTITYLRYIFVSAGALATDIALFMLLLAVAPAATASAAGYSVGIVVHWILSSRKVFSLQVAHKGAQRHKQKLLFIGSALIGLVLTVAIVGAADMFSLDPRLAKMVAIIVSFQTTYAIRSHVVFR